jgi:hypothetical protein
MNMKNRLLQLKGKKIRLNEDLTNASCSLEINGANYNDYEIITVGDDCFDVKGHDRIWTFSLSRVSLTQYL